MTQALETLSPGDWSPLAKHFYNVWCNRDKQTYTNLLKWFSDMYSNPLRPPRRALILTGPTGVGKSIILRKLAEGPVLNGHTQFVQEGACIATGEMFREKDMYMTVIEQPTFAQIRDTRVVSYTEALEELQTQVTKGIRGKAPWIYRRHNESHVMDLMYDPVGTRYVFVADNVGDLLYINHAIPPGQLLALEGTVADDDKYVSAEYWENLIELMTGDEENASIVSAFASAMVSPDYKAFIDILGDDYNE